MLIAKLHKMPNGTKVLAVCDKELLGKRFEEKSLQLDLTTRFYQGTEINENDILILFKSANIINLVGEESVNVGIRAGLVMANKKSVLTIKKIPHAQVVRM